MLYLLLAIFKFVVNKLPSTIVCTLVDPIVRKSSKEKKAVVGLQTVESWRVLLGIFDGTLCSYDLQHFGQIASIPNEPNIKGLCTMFAVHERAGVVVLVCQGKKRLFVYAYNQSVGFQFRREITLVDVPKSITCLSASSSTTVVVIIGYKKFYESIDLSTSISMTPGFQQPLANRILDVEKEHKMAMLEVIHIASFLISIRRFYSSLSAPRESVPRSICIAFAGQVYWQ